MHSKGKLTKESIFETVGLNFDGIVRGIPIAKGRIQATTVMRIFIIYPSKIIGALSTIVLRALIRFINKISFMYF